MTLQQVEKFRSDGIRTIIMPDNSERAVRMPPSYWDVLDVLKVIEGITETQLAAFALEEVKQQGLSFEQAFRGCVAHIANRWE